MNDWNSFLQSVISHLNDLRADGCDVPLLRGQADGTKPLLCGLARHAKSADEIARVESVLYYDFLSLAGPLLDKEVDSWDVLFAMQHHGLQTRLLDWTTALSSALYFALFPGAGRAPLLQPPLPLHPCIWILDPFKLNDRCGYGEVVINPQSDLDYTYFDLMTNRCKLPNSAAIAINPTRRSARQLAQHGAFTLHLDARKPLPDRSDSAIKRFEVPKDAIPDALTFLRLAGVSEYSLFPDLDGLARHLRAEHLT